jgi:hypothetical protein
MIEVSVAPSRLIVGQLEILRVQLVNRAIRACTHVILSFRLPTQVVLLDSSGQIEILSIAPGEKVTRDLRVKARQEGTFLLTSSSFSFRDSLGRPLHPEPVAITLEVLPAQPYSEVPLPLLAAGLTTSELPLDSWSLLDGWIENVGSVPIQNVELKLHLDGGGTSILASGWRRPELPPGKREIFQIPVRASQKGSHVPVRPIVLYRDLAGRPGSFTPPGISLRVVEEVQGPTRNVRIFLAAAEPVDAHPIWSGYEFQQIEEELRRGPNREHFELQHRLATEVLDLPRALLEFLPHILHISAHGEANGLALLTKAGHQKQVPLSGLAHLCQQFSDHLECVVLNACYSERQAVEISQHIPYVIGMNKAIALDSAIAFSVGFYQAIAAGRGIEKAFALGCIAIELKGYSGAEIPVLRGRS